MTLLLICISLALTVVVVLVLVAYLLGIIVALMQAHASLARVAGALITVRSQTEPLGDRLPAINGGLSALLKGLLSVNGNLAAIVAAAVAMGEKAEKERLKKAA